MRTSSIGGSLFLLAIGAIMYWAVSVEAEGFSINTAGLILMVIGVVGLILTLLMTASADEAQAEANRDVTVVDR